jgi:hypothetical protein
MYLASEGGLIDLVEDNGRWVHERTSFEGKGRAKSFTPALYAVVPVAQTNMLYAGIAEDGVYGSKDHGCSWDRLFEGDIRSLAVDPSNPLNIYTGTEPVHVYGSKDGGATWGELEGIQHLPEETKAKWWFPVPPHEAHVLYISVDPHNGQRLYVCLEHGGVLRTVDGGVTWEDVSEGLMDLDMHMVAPDPIQENVVYSASKGGFHRSENYGRGWKHMHLEGLPNGEYTHEFVFIPGPGMTTILLSTANGGPGGNWSRKTHAESAAFRSEDGGSTWWHLTGGMPAYSAQMIWSLALDPLDANRLYACTGHYPYYWKGASNGEVWTSPDRGDTWKRIYEGASPIQRMAVTLF